MGKRRGIAWWGVVIGLVGAIAAVAGPSDQAPGGAEPPVMVFAELDGTWEGDFVGWDREGRELYRIHVRQTYRTVDEHTQWVEVEDRMPDGTLVTGRGKNTARRTEDGELELRCRVEKSNGERVEHRGRLIEGPDGEEQVVWHSEGDRRWEMFREWVGREGGTEVYEIDGVGRYGDQVVVMAGRYRRVEREDR